ncbi:HAMP domain-containing histidine kinase [Novosphingobium panipatense]|jgi:hypothetical protein|uniref:HAMP domain-containing histidine kinase n=1 Tax=Novosphingobium TaxID=165696 RepID=UPI000CDA8F0D|nr:HAMP domain-containing histidine kinase [Novosphingobium sp. HII-3]
MHFDDRLATVLRLPSSGEGMARIQFRQLVDILGSAPERAGRSETVEAAFAQLERLARRLPAGERARLLRHPLQPLSNARLLGWLAEAEPDVASAAIASARLRDEEWLALVPRLPVRARGILRHRRDLPAGVDHLLEQLGVHDRGLPAAPPAEPLPEDPIPESVQPGARLPTGDIAADQDISADVMKLLEFDDQPPPPTSLSDWARARAVQQQKELQHKVAADPAASPREGIGAIVRRIEEFRKAREKKALAQAPADLTGIGPESASAPAQRTASAIDFTTNVEGRIDWADGPHAPSVTGLDLALAAEEADCVSDLAHSLRQRFAIQGAHIVVTGAPAVSGPWRVDAVPRFRHGRFEGYCGRLRRPASAAETAGRSGPHAEAERMREVLHELRTPANAIQVAAEIIQQQLYGPAPHEYRALAAAIAGDCAHILAGFEELDRLVKLESGVQAMEAGKCDLAHVLAQTIVQLRAWTEPRNSGFSLAADLAATRLPVRLAKVEAERLIWRLLAALAGSAAPGEMLRIGWLVRPEAVELSIALPAALVEREPDALFDAIAGDRGQSLAAGMFGIGFTLRLATAEATAAGGSLHRVGDVLRLSLPALAADAPDGPAMSSHRS